jgi:hypothetical protein
VAAERFRGHSRNCCCNYNTLIATLLQAATEGERMTDGRALRAALLAHKELLEAQRIQAERFGGRMSAGEVLQAAADDLRFDWLRVLSQLIAELDEALATVERERVDSVVTRARGLLAPPDAASAFGPRYLQALQDHPAVVFAHRDVVAALDRSGGVR